MSRCIAYFFWDPSPYIFDFQLPLIHRPVLWYGFFFAIGFFLAYLFLLHLLRQEFSKVEAKHFAEKIAFYVVIGTVVGARVGDLLFYQNWHLLMRDPMQAVRIWEGGLASHGGAIGILIALYLFTKRVRRFSFLALLDRVVLCTGVVCGFIRIGNFVNQELVGTPSELPWAVVFGHPADGSQSIPRHPVQLYESIFYFLLFFSFILLWNQFPRLRKPGKISGLFLIIVFSFRFFIEFFKEEVSAYLSAYALLDMAQYLSLPFILFGIFLLVRNGKKAIKH